MKLERDLARAATLATLLLCAPDAFATADRYGGVWHAGQASGAFVPISAGMSWNDVLAYRNSWSDMRITDLEVVSMGCREAEEDRFATNWERGDWKDKLEVANSLTAMQSSLTANCRRGWVLHDFEIWNTWCHGDRYIMLYREGSCDLEKPPTIASIGPFGFDSMVQAHAVNGRYLVDYEIDEVYPGSHPGGPENPTTVIGVFYGGSATQHVWVSTRALFEKHMKDEDGHTTLMDMESFLLWPDYDPEVPKTRYVMGLFEQRSQGNVDEHEVGEVYTKFRELVYLKENVRRLEDFEVYPWTQDARFVDAFASYYDDLGGGYSFSVRQAGEVVSSDARGWARRPNPNTSYPGVAMQVGTKSAVASVTKQFTTLGVLAYVQEISQGVMGLDMTMVNWWLDQPFTNLMPPDFTNFGWNMNTVSIRDLLQHKSGFADFGEFLKNNNLAFNRANIIYFLQQPVLYPNTTQRDYQNLHFEILALIMDETILPTHPSISSATDPWKEWMNEQVFAKAGVGWRICGGGPTDALSYPQVTTGPSAGIEWLPASTICTGDGTGAGMFWASSDDISKIAYAAFTAHTIVDEPIGDMIQSQRLGMDGWLNPTPLGDYGPWKNGGLGGCNALSELVGSQMLLTTYDDNDVDDDGAPDYIYDPGGTDFDVGIMNHSSNSTAGCIENPPTNIPWPNVILSEALALPEAW